MPTISIMMRYRRSCRQIFRRKCDLLILLLLCVGLSAFTLWLNSTDQEWTRKPLHRPTDRLKRFLLNESDTKEYNLERTSEEELGTKYIPYRAGKTDGERGTKTGNKPSARISPTEPRRIVFYSYGDELSSNLTDFFAMHPDVFLMRGAFANENDFRTSLGGCTATALGKLTSPRQARCQNGTACHLTSMKDLVKQCKERPYQVIKLSDSDMTKKFDWVPIVCKLTKSDEKLMVVHLVAEPLDVVYNRLVHRLTLARRDVLDKNDTASALDAGKQLCTRIHGDLSLLGKANCNKEKVKSFSVENIVLNLPDSWLELHNYLGTYVDDRTKDLLDETSISESLKNPIHRRKTLRRRLFPKTLVKNLNEMCGGIKI